MTIFKYPTSSEGLTVGWGVGWWAEGGGEKKEQEDEKVEKKEGEVDI